MTSFGESLSLGSVLRGNVLDPDQVRKLDDFMAKPRDRSVDLGFTSVPAPARIGQSAVAETVQFPIPAPGLEFGPQQLA